MCTKEQLKKYWDNFITLKAPLLVDKWAEKLQQYVHQIYLIAIAVLGLCALSMLVTLLTGKISASFVGFIFIVIDFIIVRMFCEFLLTYKKK